MDDAVYRLLTAPRKTRYKIEQLRSKESAIRYTMMPSGIRYDTDKVQSSPSDVLPEKMAKLDELERRERELLNEYDSEIASILKACDGIGKEPEKTVLVMQYVGGLKMIEIAKRMDYSVSNAYTIRSNGYKLLAEYLKVSKNCNFKEL